MNSENKNNIKIIDNIKNEIIIKNKNWEELKLKIEQINSEKKSNIKIIDDLKNEIISKNNIFNDQMKTYQELKKENSNIKILKDKLDKANNDINELKNK